MPLCASANALVPPAEAGWLSALRSSDGLLSPPLFAFAIDGRVSTGPLSDGGLSPTREASAIAPFGWSSGADGSRTLPDDTLPAALRTWIFRGL